MDQTKHYIRQMLIFIYSSARKNGERLVSLDTIEQAMPNHRHSIFSWCQWCMAAQVLHADGDSYYLDSRFNGMNFAEFRQAIYSTFI